MKNTERIEVLEYQVRTLSEQTAILSSALLEMLDSTYKSALKTSTDIGESIGKGFSLLITTGMQNNQNKKL